MRSPEELRDPDRRAPRPVQPAMPDVDGGTTESALAFPAWRTLPQLLLRALRLRCPHCGRGAVLRPYATVNHHCSHCGFRFTRSSDSYYSGAMLTNLAVAELLFALVFVGVLLITWPDVPWNTLTWAMPLGVALAPVLLLPFAKVLWLAFDIAIRPVHAAEFDTPMGR